MTSSSSDPYAPVHNRFTASAAAAASSYFGSHAAVSALGPYAAYQNMMSMNWNSYSMASFQSLQRAGVTYGESGGEVSTIKLILLRGPTASVSSVTFSASNSFARVIL